ncbi:MAG: DUF6430 domain-containing protein [Alphaproteobacteria bacterium]|nr:DUF6430 domain-containing protein [Alphaproteobacteria bacterium]
MLGARMSMASRSTRDFFVFGFATYGVLWTIVESLGLFFPNQNPEGVYWYSILVVASVIAGLWKGWPKRRVELKIPATDSSIEIKFGDVFLEEGIVVIPVNEYFDGSLGDHVSERSLHGIFVRNVMGGQSNAFYDLVDQALDSVEAKSVRRKSGRKKQYPIGTVACVDVNGRKYLLAALSRTNLESLKASATVHELWECLSGVWQGVRDHSNGEIVNVPLVGSGLSGVGLPPRNLVEIILTSFVFYTKKQKVADKVTLVLPTRLRWELDLETLKRSWV